MRNVLLLDTDGEDSLEVEEAFAAAGYDVRRCHETGLPAFPCNGLLPGGTCPLDADDIDVAVVVRQHPWPRPTALEDGASCALRRNLPLVVAGRTVLNPYDGWATVTIDGTDDVVDAAERAAAFAMEQLSGAARDAFVDVLTRHGIESDVRVTTEVVNHRLRAHITVDEPPPSRVVGFAAVRAGQALRAHDRWVGGIDVSVATPAGEVIGS